MQSFMTALADPLRRAALALIWDRGEHCICEIQARLDITQSRASRHMKTLKLAGIISDRRDAQWVRYRRNPALPADRVAIIEAVLRAEQNMERDVA